MAKNQIENNIQDIYSLTSTQEGMLYYKLLDSQSTSYFVQQISEIKGDFNLDNAKDTFDLLLYKYDVFRTLIVHSSTSNPFQIVLNERETDFNFIDISHLVNIQEQFDKICKEDINRGFDFEKDTLIRFIIVKTQEEQYKMILSFHHIIMDGWCLSLVFGDFLRYYGELKKGKKKEELIEDIDFENEDEIKYGDYVRWLGEQDKEEGLGYWKELLRDFSEPSEVAPLGVSEKSENQIEKIGIKIKSDVRENLIKLCEQENVTMNTILESTWGILLQKYNRTQDVVFGKVVSGRDADIEGIDKVVGLFINTIPMRVKSDNDTVFNKLLHLLQNQALESMNYDYCSLSEIQNNTIVGTELIKTLFVYENYYIDEEYIQIGLKDINIKVENFREQTNYPITVSVSNDSNLEINIMYHPNIYNKSEINSNFA